MASASKKRASEAVDNVDEDVPKKHQKKNKPAATATAESATAPPSSSTAAVSDSAKKPMERRKKRKALDKQRRQKPKTSEPNPKPEPQNPQPASISSSDAASPPSSPTSVLPEFHIGVFTDLVSADPSVRESAAEKMVTELCAVEEAYDNLENKELGKDGLHLEAEKDDGLKHCAPSLRYAVGRLIRGVSSSNKCARQGFALGLTILVDEIHSVGVSSLLKLISEFLEVSSSTKGQDARDCLLGRLFAYGAIARSGRMYDEWTSDNNTPYIKELISHLISLASGKRYMQEPAVAIILELVEQLPTEALLSHVTEASVLQEWFKKAKEEGNPDALLLALKLNEKISTDLDFGGLLPCPFSPTKFFAADHLSSLVNCLKEATFCQPRVHSIWKVLVNTLLPDKILQGHDAGLNPKKKHKKHHNTISSEDNDLKNFKNFCEVIIEGSLLLSSHDRKHLAFDVLLLLLPRIPASFAPTALSCKLVQCLMDILSTKDSWLFKVAQYFLKGLSDWVNNDDGRRVAVIVAIQKNSNGKFDCITRTKTIKNLMAEFNSEVGCVILVQNLVRLFVDEGSSAEEPSDQSQTTDDNSEIGSGEDKDSTGASENYDFLRSWIVDSLPQVLKFLKLDPEPKLRVQIEILKFLAVQGLFSSSLGTEVTSVELQEKFKWPKTATSSALCRMCINQLQSLLANAQKGEVPFVTENAVEGNDLGSYFMGFFSKLRSIPSVSLFLTLSDEDEKALEKLQAMESRLYREERNCGLSKGANKLHALRYLLIQLLLQVLMRPGEVSETALELIICCKKAFSLTDLLDDSGDVELDDDESPAVMDVLVDALLSLMPQSSAPIRSAIEQVFKYFCNDVTDDGLLRMLRVIKRNLKPARHHDKGSEDEDDEDFLDIEESEESDEEDTGETVESDQLMDDSEAVTGAVVKEFPEASDESDGGMDDEEMFRMDNYLARILKERKNQGGSETTQSQLVLFKLRVLSLLEIYLHENSGKPQVLTVYSNLAQAFVNPHTAEASEQLEQRIWGILQKRIFKAKEYPRGDGVQLPVLESMLEKNLKLASRPFKKKKSTNNLSKKKQSASWNRYKMVVTLAQNSAFWILKIIDGRNFQEAELQKVYDILESVLVSFFDSKKSQLKSQFLKELFRRRPWIGHHLFGFLLERCGGAKLEFRQVEALDFLNDILKSQVSVRNNEDGQERSRNILISHLPRLCHLIEVLVTNVPGKQTRRAEVRLFCRRIFQFISTFKLKTTFLEMLDTDAQAACKSQLGDVFLALLNI